MKKKDKSNPVVKWQIRHPGTGEPLIGETFEECMEKWFEGFNLPFQYTNGIREDFETANNRVNDYFKKLEDNDKNRN